jgi:hypothetical protein
MSGLIGFLYLISEIIAVLILFGGIALWIMNDRRGAQMAVGAAFVLVLTLLAPNFGQFFFGTSGTTLESGPLVIAPSPLVFDDSGVELIRVVGIKYFNDPIAVKMTVKYADGASKTYTINTGSDEATFYRITTVTFPNKVGGGSTGWQIDPETGKEYYPGNITFTYTYKGKTYSITYDVEAVKKPTIFGSDSVWAKVFISILNLIIELVGTVIKKIFFFVPDPLMSLIFFTTLPPTTLGHMPDLYAPLFY